MTIAYLGYLCCYEAKPPATVQQFNFFFFLTEVLIKGPGTTGTRKFPQTLEIWALAQLPV